MTTYFDDEAVQRLHKSLQSARQEAIVAGLSQDRSVEKWLSDISDYIERHDYALAEADLKKFPERLRKHQLNQSPAKRRR